MGLGQATRATPASGYRYVRKQWRILFTTIDWLGWLIFGAMRKLIGRTSAPHATPARVRNRSKACTTKLSTAGGNASHTPAPSPAPERPAWIAAAA